MARTYEVHLDGGYKRVTAFVEVEAESEEDARSEALDCIDTADWEIDYNDRVYASDVQVTAVHCMDDDD